MPQPPPPSHQSNSSRDEEDDGGGEGHEYLMGAATWQKKIRALMAVRRLGNYWGTERGGKSSKKVEEYYKVVSFYETLVSRKGGGFVPSPLPHLALLAFFFFYERASVW